MFIGICSRSERSQDHWSTGFYLKIEKSKSPLFPWPIAAVDTNDWCIVVLLLYILFYLFRILGRFYAVCAVVFAYSFIYLSIYLF